MQSKVDGPEPPASRPCSPAAWGRLLGLSEPVSPGGHGRIALRIRVHATPLAQVSPQRPWALLLFFEPSAPTARHPAFRGPESQELGGHITQENPLPCFGGGGEGARAARSRPAPHFGVKRLFTKMIPLTSQERPSGLGPSRDSARPRGGALFPRLPCGPAKLPPPPSPLKGRLPPARSAAPLGGEGCLSCCSVTPDVM